jgi:hypothetical protein
MKGTERSSLIKALYICIYYIQIQPNVRDDSYSRGHEASDEASLLRLHVVPSLLDRLIFAFRILILLWFLPSLRIITLLLLTLLPRMI